VQFIAALGSAAGQLISRLAPRSAGAEALSARNRSVGWSGPVAKLDPSSLPVLRRRGEAEREPAGSRCQGWLASDEADEINTGAHCAADRHQVTPGRGRRSILPARAFPGA